MKIKALLDTNTFIYGFEYRQSNAAKLLDLLNEGKLEAYINWNVLKEVTNYFKRRYSKDEASKFVKYIVEACTLLHEEDYALETTKLAGKINTKDLSQLAAARAFEMRLVSFDRDFKGFPEYTTPKQFIVSLGLKPAKTEY